MDLGSSIEPLQGAHLCTETHCRPRGGRQWLLLLPWASSRIHHELLACSHPVPWWWALSGLRLVPSSR